MPCCRILPAFLFSALLFAQNAPVFIDEADLRDQALLDTTLASTISPEDIRSSDFAQDLAEKQADEMMAASQRRLQRMEQRIQQVQTAVAAGQAKQEELTTLLDQMHLRIETGRLVISRATVVKEIVRSARADSARKSVAGRRTMEKFGGNGRFSTSDLALVEKAFAKRFRRPLPISADGDTSLHRALGLDHTGRVDVAVAPDQLEGVWLRKYLESLRIPYYAFRKAVVGSATAPHIHIGPPSIRHLAIRRQNTGTKATNVRTPSRRRIPTVRS